VCYTTPACPRSRPENSRCQNLSSLSCVRCGPLKPDWDAGNDVGYGSDANNRCPAAPRVDAPPPFNAALHTKPQETPTMEAFNLFMRQVRQHDSAFMFAVLHIDPSSPSPPTKHSGETPGHSPCPSSRRIGLRRRSRGRRSVFSPAFLASASMGGPWPGRSSLLRRPSTLYKVGLRVGKVEVTTALKTPACAFFFGLLPGFLTGSLLSPDPSPNATSTTPWTGQQWGGERPLRREKT